MHCVCVCARLHVHVCVLCIFRLVAGSAQGIRPKCPMDRHQSWPPNRYTQPYDGTGPQWRARLALGRSTSAPPVCAIRFPRRMPPRLDSGILRSIGLAACLSRISPSAQGYGILMGWRVPSLANSLKARATHSTAGAKEHAVNQAW